MKNQSTTLYEELNEAGCELDNHESDLYVLVTPISSKIIVSHSPIGVSVFKSPQDQKVWYDIPFQFDPFWEKKSQSINH